MADALTKKSTTETLGDLLRARKDSLAQLVPQHLTVERLMRVAVGAVAKTPKLQECTPTSLLQAVMVGAELGLEPGGALGHLYLVPYGTVCTAIVGYRGLIELAYRSGQVASIRAVVRYEKDLWDRTEGFSPDLKHVPYDGDDAGPLKSVYCVITMKDGTRLLDVMSKAAVEKVRERSKSGKSGPWETDYEEMAKKTVVRRALKYAPLSSERLEKALEVDNEDFIDGVVAESAIEAPAAALKERVARKARLLQVPTELPLEAPAEAVAAEPGAQG